MASDLPRIELAQRAVRDVRKMQPADRRLVRDALDALARGSENLDIKAVAGRKPWLRVRAGDWRVLARPLTSAEARKGGRGWLVARVVNRRELERALRSLHD